MLDPGALRTAYLSRPLPKPAPVLAAPKCTNQPCPRCMESELVEGESGLECPSCRYQCTRKQLEKVTEQAREIALAREIEQCRLEDERRGERGGSSSSGKKREKVFRWASVDSAPVLDRPETSTTERVFIRPIPLRIPRLEASTEEVREAILRILRSALD